MDKKVKKLSLQIILNESLKLQAYYSGEPITPQKIVSLLADLFESLDVQYDDYTRAQFFEICINGLDFAESSKIFDVSFSKDAYQMIRAEVQTLYAETVTISKIHQSA